MLREFACVLRPNGCVLIFDPCISALGALVFGPLHHEPIAYHDSIVWNAPPGWDATQTDYCAAQGNATRVFFGGERSALPDDWNVVHRQRFSAISYIATGGYSKPQLYPDRLYPLLRSFEWAFDLAPTLFATRLLAVLEKR